MRRPQSAGLGRTGTGTSACDHTYPACYAARRTCCSNATLVGGMFFIVREPCANNYFHTPLAEHVQLYTTTRNISIHSRVSELTSTGCTDRSGKASIADGKDLQANHAGFFTWLWQLDTVSHPLTALKSIYIAFFIDICNNLLDSNLSKVSTDAKSNPEFIKPKRRAMPYCKDNHIIMCPRFGLLICEVLVVNNAQSGAECAYLPPHWNMVGGTRHPSRHSVWRRSIHPLCC